MMSWKGWLACFVLGSLGAFLKFPYCIFYSFIVGTIIGVIEARANASNKT